MQHDLAHYLIQFSYLGIFLWFLVIEQLTPIPEEVSLMSLGYLCMHTHLNPWMGGIVAFGGLLITDSGLFYLSSRGNRLTQRLTNKLSPSWQEKVRKSMQKNAKKTLFVSALVPKLRFLSPVLAATTGIKWKLFFWVDAGATLFYVTVYMLAGILFHDQLTRALAELYRLQHAIFSMAMLSVVVYVTLWARRTFFKKTS